MADHASTRAMERLGVNFDAQEAARVVREIKAGRLRPEREAGAGRSWYIVSIQGVPAWCLYDPRISRIITVLGETPHGVAGGPKTFFALADECGIAHAEAKRIAASVYSFLRHAHKTQTITFYQEQKLRPLFYAAVKTAVEVLPMSNLARIAEPMARAMTVKQVAEALGCDDETVRRHIKAVWPNLFENGRTTYLDESMVLYVKNKISESGRNDLRNVAEVKNIHTELEMKQKAAEVVAWLAGETDRLRAELAQSTEALAIAAPKAESFDRFLDASGSICIQDAAKELGRPPIKFFADLALKGLIFKRGGDWLPAEIPTYRGWFEVKTRTFGAPPNEHITRQTRVTPKGLDGLARMFPKSEVSA